MRKVERNIEIRQYEKLVDEKREISIFGLGNLFSLFLVEKKLEDHCTCFIVVEYNYISKCSYNHI